MRLTSGQSAIAARHRRALAAALVIVALATGVVPGVDAATAPEPKIVIVVGPVGSLTREYRAEANVAARAARRHTGRVVTIYSPNATWPVVRDALQGASIVVYLGHGNGWPSRYRDHLYPPTQNGLGLNPIAGEDDKAHQYFGEAYLERDVRLAPHAVVIMHRLCYASGNTEPGLPEGTLDQARQRVDNFAAGWQAAGADAVIADAFFGPAWYIDTLFRRRGTIESIWLSAPSFNDHVIAFASERRPGRTALLDPTRPRRGFYRSLAGRLGLRAAEVVGGRRDEPARAASRIPVATSPVVPSLASAGATFSAPLLAPAAADGAVSLVAGGRAALTLPVTVPDDTALPRTLQLGVRWDPIELNPDTIDPAEPGASPGPGASPSPGASPEPGASAPGASPEPGASPSPEPGASAEAAPDPAAEAGDVDPPSISGVVPEALGQVVTTSAASLGQDGLVAAVDLPATPGRYRLVTTIHDEDGTAHDAATQALVASVLVHVSPRVSVAFGVVPQMRLVAGTRASALVRIANDGEIPWTGPPREGPRPGLFDPPAKPTFIITTWVALGAGVDTSGNLTATEVELVPGEQAVVRLPLVPPDIPGTYLVVLDLLTPAYGSLAAAGIPATTVRVVVEAAEEGAPGPSRRHSLD